jgi:prepilin-type N-terminal cleavage/methylation domain-containing protein
MRGNKKNSGFTLPNFSKKNLRGFTLTEILVTTAIIVILSGLVIANSGAGQSQLALSRSANKLAQDLRRAQEMAMSAKECDKCGGVIPPRYGIYIHAPDGDFYVLYADINNDGLYDYPTDPDDKLIEKIYYEKGVVLNSINGVGCNPSPPIRGHITFAPPDPATEIKIGKVGQTIVQCSEIVLTIRAGTAGPTKSVRVNQAGLISVE